MLYFGYYILQEKKAKEALTRKQEKNRSKQQKQQQEEDSGPTELLQKPKEYIVKFNFPEPPPLNPPVLGLYGKCGEAVCNTVPYSIS